MIIDYLSLYSWFSVSMILMQEQLKKNFTYVQNIDFAMHE